MATADASKLRRAMLDGQLRPNRLTDLQLQEAIMAVPREAFVPPALRGVAYVDDDVPLGGGRWLMEPMVLARLLQAAELESGDVMLDVGCATGYSTAVAAQLAGTVVALENDPDLVRQANENLAALGVLNAVVVKGELPHGYPDQAPYQAVLLNGAVDRVPETLLRQVAEGGRLLAVERCEGVGRAVLYLREGGLIGRRALFDAAVNPLPGFHVEPGFAF